jgi:hypothetical protein
VPLILFAYAPECRWLAKYASTVSASLYQRSDHQSDFDAKAGLTDYETFARAVLKDVKSKPISFEVFFDDFPEMRRQALKIRDWQDNVYVKNTSGESSVP